MSIAPTLLWLAVALVPQEVPTAPERAAAPDRTADEHVLRGRFVLADGSPPSDLELRRFLREEVGEFEVPPGHEAFREHLRRAATREFFAAPVAVRWTEAGPIPAVVPVPADER